MSLARFKVQLATAAPDDSAEQAAQTMRDRGVGCLLVIRSGHPSGILTDRDLVVRVLAEGRAAAAVRVGDIATYDPVTVSLSEGLETAAERMRVHGVRRLPLVDERGEAVGIITADDLLVLFGRQLAAICEGIENRADSTESR